jgi:hypothetical protein
MSILNYLRQEYVKGTVVEKYGMRNGNVGLVVEDAKIRRRYHVENMSA